MNFVQIIDTYNLSGLLIGLATFIIIGIFHPLVIKGYYYFGLKCRWWFLIGGIIALVLAICVKSIIGSSLLGVTAFSFFWSIKEVNEQAVRVRKGWFPANPRRNDQ